MSAGPGPRCLAGGVKNTLRALKDLPARRFGQPEDIAHAIELSMTNPYMTGHTLTVDGGLVAT